MSTHSMPSLGQLQRALKISEQIQELKAEMAAVLGNSGVPVKSKTAPASASAPRAKRKYTRKAASAVTSATDGVASAAPVKTKRTMSPEAREKIAAAQRARWAKQMKKTKKAKKS